MFHGSIIFGTHRLVDLVPAFLDALDGLNPNAADRIRAEYADVLDAIDAHTGELDVDVGEDGTFLVEDLIDALNDCAPDGTYFGAHPYDGADFGFWPLDDDEDDYDDRMFLEGLDDDDVDIIMSWG